MCKKWSDQFVDVYYIYWWPMQCPDISDLNYQCYIWAEKHIVAVTKSLWGNFVGPWQYDLSLFLTWLIFISNWLSQQELFLWEEVKYIYVSYFHYYNPNEIDIKNSIKLKKNIPLVSIWFIAVHYVCLHM